MSDPRYRHLYDCIAFLDQRWDAMTAEMRAKAVQVEAELHMRIAALTSELAEARRQLGEAVEVQEDLAGKLFDAVRERDALKAGKWAGAWRWDDTGEWCSRHRPNEDVHTVELAMRGTGFMWRFRFEAGEQAGSLDAAKAAADAHLVANGWWLENSK